MNERTMTWQERIASEAIGSLQRCAAVMNDPAASAAERLRAACLIVEAGRVIGVFGGTEETDDQCGGVRGLASVAATDCK